MPRKPSNTQTTAMDLPSDNAVAEVICDDGRIAGFTREKVEIVKAAIAPDFTDMELALFLHQATRLGLDPMASQIYAFKSKGRICIGARIDGFRLIADRTGCYAPGRPTEYTTEENNLISATAYVRKFVQGEWVEVSETAWMSEFKGSSGNWVNMPRVMLSKCAEARALRRAFPAELSNLYEEAERAAIERNGAPQTRTATQLSNWAPPPEEPPPALAPPAETPRAFVWRVGMKELGASQEEMKAAIQQAGVPEDSKTWTYDHGDKVLATLEENKGA